MSDVRKTRGAYMAGTVTKESILDVATRLVAANGYHGFSLRDVARLVGISHPAVIYHFPTKEILLYSVSQRCEQSLGMFSLELDKETGRLEHKGLIQETIGQLGICLLRLGNSPDYRVMTRFDLTMAVEGAAIDHPLHMHYQKKFDELEEFLAKELKDLVDKGIATIPVKPEAAARHLISSWYGSIAAEKYINQEENSADSVGMYMSMVTRFLGLSPDTILSIAVSLPEDLVQSFQRAIKVNKGIGT